MFHHGIIVAILSIIALAFAVFFVSAVAYVLWPLTISVVVVYVVGIAVVSRRYSSMYDQLNTAESIEWIANQALNGTETAKGLTNEALPVLGPHAIATMERLRDKPTDEKMPDVDELIRALDDPQEVVRHDALLKLGDLRDPRAVKPITELLVDTEEQIRVDAAKILGESRDAQAVGPLIQALDYDDNELQAAAAQGLGNLGDQRARRPLTQLLNSSSNPYVQSAARDALTKLGGPLPPREIDMLGWMPLLPFPLASILWAYHADQDAGKKHGHLLGFFEALSIFVPTLMLSAMVNNDDVWLELDQRFGAALRSKPLGDFSAPSFRNWVLLGQRLAEAFRVLQQEATWERYCGLFGGPGDRFLELVTNEKLYSMLHAVVDLRNKHAHGGSAGDEEAERKLNEVEEWLPNAYEIISDRFASCRIMSPVSGTYVRGTHHYKVKNLVGPNTPFKEDSAETVRTMDSARLYVLYGKSHAPIELLPFFKMIRLPDTKQEICFFYSSREKKGVYRLVSYYYEYGSEVREADEGLNVALSLLTTSPLRPR